MIPADTMEFVNGLTARIYHDPDAGQPFGDDEAVRIAAWEQANAAEWFTIPLFLYDHSGTVYRTGRSNPFTCPWDSGRVGLIALKRGAWGGGNEPGATLAEYARSIAREYTDWANGESYGYVLQDGAGVERGCCWGFIGMDAVRHAAASAADSCNPGGVADDVEPEERKSGFACPQCGAWLPPHG